MSKTEFDKRKGTELWFYCNSCQRKTSHKVLAGVDYSDSDEIEPDFSIEIYDNSDIVQCGGCKSITFTKRTWHSENYYPGVQNIIEQFPPKEESSRSLVQDDIYELPPLLQQIYKETLQAIANKSFTLAGIGLRAIIENICKDKKTKGRNLENRIDNLANDGFLTAKGAEILHGIRLIGNYAAHETKPPTIKQIKAALVVVDHLISGIYIIPKQAANTLPKRQKKTTKKKSTSKPGVESGKK